MVAVTLFSLLVLSSFGATWTGKIADTYDIAQLNMFAESAVYDDGYVYLSHMGGNTIHKIDVDDLNDGKTTPTDKVKVSEAHDQSTSLFPVGCCEGKSDRIYCTLGTPFLAGPNNNNGIAYWDMDDLTFKKSILRSTTGLANDCYVTDDHVYWSSAFSGEVLVSDHDLTYVNLISDATVLSPISFGGAMGHVHIEEDGEEFLIVANYDRAEIVKVPVKDGALNGVPANVNIPTDSTRYFTNDSGQQENLLQGLDGLVKIADDVLVGVTAHYVLLFETSDNWVSATIKKSVYAHTVEGSDQWGPANAAVKSNDKEEVEVYVTFPGFTSFFASQSRDSFKFALVKFSDEDVDDLDFSLALMSAILLAFF